MHRFGDNATLAEALSGRIAADLQDALEARGAATLAVSGGSTPAPLFAALSRRMLDWARVTVTLVDERWVDEKHPDSNARLVREGLLRGAAGGSHFVGLKTAAASPFEAEADVARRLAPFAHAIDVVVLGMGEDGHIASFFPGADTLDRALDPQGQAPCVAVAPPVAPHPRMTLSLPVLQRARHRYLHIVGPAKRAVLERALAGSDARQLPVRAVLGTAHAPTEIYYAERS